MRTETQRPNLNSGTLILTLAKTSSSVAPMIVMSERISLVESSAFSFQGAADDGSQERDTLIATPTTKASSPPNCSGGWIVWTQRCVQKMSRYWRQHSHSSSDCERPDRLICDFVMPTEIARKRVPEGYNEKTVRLAPDGSLYLRNRYKQKI